VVPPPGTVTEEGTTAEAPLLDNDTVTPPEGAAAVRTTYPVADVPPVTLAGWTETRDGTGAALCVGAKTAAPGLLPGAILFTIVLTGIVLTVVEITDTVPEPTLLT
jgi:hypothetical protein